ncbi:MULTISPECIES: hypothetical protein [Pseudomonas]|uniref:hypothetical protein n=1 Tax=Pseudomonas TaxID=286 RepID=UPI000272C77A|nr:MULTISPECIES: hypothetical protein [Pseudomonas]UEL22316.1 hypothetical protein K6106_20620 [Pseudomonas fluorescens]EJF68643.1 hypothetical protein A462_27553 [Pseudomonas sp. Ag1]EPL11098.1 hypothetical protein CF150_14003 [Pseudomonas sp. CF150]PYD34834.1 hypothetical protein DND67_09885 [Pseudomonas syringae pv. pisi]RMV60581.1 hypothetical protein ALP08_04019 [Pseudomonas syringae pv. pisi]
MSKDSKTLLAGIFEHLRVLRATVAELESVVEIEVDALRGSQTVDVDDSIRLSFVKLQDQIGAMEETLATIAEATGEIPKL